MATIDYKEKYEKAVQAAMLAKQDTESAVTIGILEEIFPELRESEDERIRKEIITYLSTVEDKELIPYESWIAWLEKQGEQNTTKDYSTLEITDVVRQALQECESFSNIMADVYAARVGATVEKLIKKQGEQKPNPCDECVNRKGCINCENGELRETEQKPAEFDNTNAKQMFIKALERVEEQNNKGYKLTDCDKNSWWEDFKVYTTSEQTISNSSNIGKNEQKPTDKIEPKFKVGDIITPKDGGHEPWQIMQVDISDKKYRFKDGYVIHFSQEDDYEIVEQNPAWSEEDEYCRHQLIVFCENCMQPDSGAKRCAHWLKSIKDRYTWKPSDEQIEALWNVYQGGKEQAELATLYNDLKKLR